MKRFVKALAICGSSALLLGTGVGVGNAEDVSIEEAEAALGMSFEEYSELQDRYEALVPDGPIVTDGVVEDDKSSRPRMTDRTANPNPENFDSVAAIWYAIPPNAELGVIRGCTANYVGGKFWLTAAHCVSDKFNFAFIEQSDGEFAGIERYYRPRGDYDIALLKVGTGIHAKPFKLPSKAPEVGQRLNVVGYAGKHNFASRSTVQVTDVNMQVNLDSNVTYHGEFIASPVAPLKYPTKPGDSGAGAFDEDGNVLYGLLSGGDDRADGYTDVSKHVEWIEKVMKTQSSTSLQERIWAFKGGAQAKLAARATTIMNNVRQVLRSFSSDTSAY